VRFWNGGAGEPRRILPPLLRLDYPATSLCWSPRGDWLATAGADRVVRFWDADRCVERRKLIFRSEVAALASTPDGLLAVSEGRTPGVVHVYDPASGRRLRSLPGDRGALPSLVLSPNGAELAAARAPAGQSERKCVMAVRDFQTGEWVGRCGGPLSIPTCAAFSLDGTLLAAASQDETLRVWNVESLKEIRRIKLKAVATAIAFAGDLLLAGDVTGRLCRWKLESGETLPPLQAHEGEIFSLTASSDYRVLATVGRDDTTLLWSLKALAGE
jgi:WD40 repeat protein